MLNNTFLTFLSLTIAVTLLLNVLNAIEIEDISSFHDICRSFFGQNYFFDIQSNYCHECLGSCSLCIDLNYCEECDEATIPLLISTFDSFDRLITWGYRCMTDLSERPSQHYYSTEEEKWLNCEMNCLDCASDENKCSECHPSIHLSDDGACVITSSDLIEGI